jgi:hypothetical protein
VEREEASSVATLNLPIESVRLFPAYRGKYQDEEAPVVFAENRGDAPDLELRAEFWNFKRSVQTGESICAIEELQKIRPDPVPIAQINFNFIRRRR